MRSAVGAWAGYMHSVRVSRGAAVVAVIVWQFAALVLLPAALCCHAVVAHDDEDVPACCKGAHHGAACPMSRGSGAAHGAESRGAGHDAEMDHGAAQGARDGMHAGHPRVHTCHLLDDALIGLLGLTVLAPDTFTLEVAPAVTGGVAQTRHTAISLAGVPHIPPPRI